MNVLLLSTNDITGGAGRAAYRLHEGLRHIGHISNMLVQNKSGEDNTVTGPLTKLEKIFSMLRPHIDYLPLTLFPHHQAGQYHLQWAPSRLGKKIKPFFPELVHLHWICRGFISIRQLSKINKPLIWTLHDSWPFTGGCHIPYNCTNYLQSCGACFQLGSQYDKDLSRWVWQRKKKLWENIDMTIVTPSSWLANCARNSSLFGNRRIEIIPNGLDLNRYKPIAKETARNILNLPQEKRLLLFGGVTPIDDYQKGFHTLLRTLDLLGVGPLRKNLELVVFGASRPASGVNLPITSHFLGYLHDEISLALLYSAVDVLLVPSIQENLPYTIMESMACSTPCVAFNVGGIPEMISHLENGYLAKPSDPADLSFGINWILSDPRRYLMIRQAARAKIERDYDIYNIAHRYSSLYQEVMMRGTL